jgi:hypothetical protein
MLMNNNTLPKNQPNELKAFFLPMTEDLFLDKRLTWGEKCLILLISSLDYSDRHCFASNRLLAEKMGWEINSLSNALTKIRKMGWVWNVGDDNGNRMLMTPLSRSSLVPGPRHLNSTTSSSIDYGPRHLYSTGLYKEEILEEEIEEKSKPKGSHSDSKQPEITQVFEYWRSFLNHPKSKLDDNRRRRIAARLKTFSVDDLKRAIEGVKKSPWHMGDNPGRVVYDGIQTIFKTNDQVEKFIQLADKEDLSTNGPVVADFIALYCDDCKELAPNKCIQHR